MAYAFEIGMFNDSNTGYHFFYGLMAFAKDLVNNSYTFASHSLTTPLVGSNSMENYQFGEMVRQNRNHLEMQKRHQRNRLRRQRQKEDMIFCRYCPNKMSAHCMAGKFVNDVTFSSR